MKLRSLKAKLIIGFGILVILICGGLFAVSSVFSYNAVSSNVDESLTQLAKQSAKVVSEKVGDHLDILETLVETDAIKGDTLTLDKKLDLLKKEVERNGHLRINIVDTNGRAKNTNGDVADVSDREYFIKALSGEKAVSDPIYSKIDNSLIIAYAVPIKDGNTVKGVLVAIRDGYELSEIIKDVLFKETGNAFMINSKGTTVADQADTSLVADMYNDFESVKDDPELESLVKLEQKMIAGEIGTGEYSYNGVVKYMGYAPVEGTDWSLAITAPKTDVMKEVNRLKTTLIICGIAFTVFGIVIAYIIASSISKPIKMATNYLNVVATGDFSKAVPDKLLKMKDETGILANAINTMQQSIKDIIKKVVEESSNVSEKLININSKMDLLNKGIEEVSATTEELSAGSEQTAASTEEMNATSREIQNAVESIAAKAQEGAALASDVNKMSQEMKQNAILSKENALKIYTKTKNDLQNAIEQSKAVKQIHELSEAITSINSQTNLLALNAAIEAARAGESGKGFAVVADEIRMLAENSQETIARIQDITKVILAAVENLASSSGEIMDFIDKKVLNDYDQLVTSNEMYSENSNKLTDMVTDFSATSEQLLASIESIVKAIDDITQSTNDGAQGATNIAQEATEIAKMSNDVIKLSEWAKQNSEALIKTVSSFKV